MKKITAIVLTALLLATTPVFAANRAGRRPNKRIIVPTAQPAPECRLGAPTRCKSPAGDSYWQRPTPAPTKENTDR